MMRGLRHFLNTQEKYFQVGGRFERFAPLYRTAYSFFYESDQATASAPHIRDANSIGRISLITFCALVPAVGMALFNTGLQANLAATRLETISVPGWRGALLSFLSVQVDPSSITENMVHGAVYVIPVVLVSIVTGFVWEAVFAVFRRKDIDEMFPVIALLFALLMPPTIPLWQVVLGVSFGLVFGKLIFGGLGRNVLNPALVGYAFLFFAYPANMAGDTAWVAMDGVTQATPLSQLHATVEAVSVTWQDAFIGRIPGAMGETSALACLIGAVILVVTGIASWRVIAGALAGMIGIAVMFNAIDSATNALFRITPVWHAVLGGFAFGTAFLATDPVTGAVTNMGKLVYGFMIGSLTVLARVVNPAYDEGMMLAILFCNVFAPVIDRIAVHIHIKRRNARYGQ